MTISVLILTYDEAANIGECIGSLPWRDDIHVLDSNSSDETRQIAAKAGAKVHIHPFRNYAEQRNFGLALPFANEWVVGIDADERMTPELATEIEQRIRRAGPNEVMYRVRRKDIFMGRWLRRASGYPTWFPRVFRRGHVQVTRDYNEEYVPLGHAASLNGHILHFPFNKGLEWWFDRHNRYSTMETRIMVDERRNRPLVLSQIISSDPAKRRVTLKQIATRLPGRPILAFLYFYLVRLGFLDGRAGFHYAAMRLAYEIMIDAKLAACRYEGMQASRAADGTANRADG